MPTPTTALIIDDESHVRSFLRLVLVELGVRRVWEATNGQQGLEMCTEHAPGLVLLDLNLPVLGGLEVLKRLTAERPEIPVVVVSSQNIASGVVECQRQGAAGYVLKHTPRAELVEVLRGILEGAAEDGTHVSETGEGS